MAIVASGANEAQVVCADEHCTEYSSDRRRVPCDLFAAKSSSDMNDIKPLTRWPTSLPLLNTYADS